MTATRQDAWSEDDDLLLAEVVLRHIREGSTQLNAFEEVGYRLNRTSAACGFRWNSLVRKRYEAAIQIAKAQRKQRKAKGLMRTSYQPENSHTLVDDIEAAQGTTAKASQGLDAEEQDIQQMDQVIRYLKQQKQSMQQIKQLEAQLQEKEKELNKLYSHNQSLQKELETIQAKFNTINEDYQALIQIMDRARRLAVLSDEQSAEAKINVKMAPNGNLERIDRD